MQAEMTLTSHRTSGAPQTIMALGAAGVVMLLVGAAYAQSPSGIVGVVAAGAAPNWRRRASCSIASTCWRRGRPASANSCGAAAPLHREIQSTGRRR